MFGSLSARQSRTNQPPGSDAVAVPLALARPTTEWHQHIQNRRSDPHIAAQISRGPTGMGRPRCRVGAGGVLFVSGHARSPGCFCGGVWVWVVSVSDMGKAPWGVCSEGLPVRVVRRRATLPHPVGCSTIAVPGLSFRVRNGTGRLTWAMAAANLLLYGQTLGSAGLWRPGNRTADADMSMFRLVARQCSLPSGVVCRRKMRSPKESGNVSVAFRPLVPVGSTPRGASTSGLSTTCSAWGLQELEGSTECLSWSRLPA